MNEGRMNNRIMNDTNKHAIILLHFGDKLKYFELELYFVQMLRKNIDSNVDLVYMYTKSHDNDNTPEFFIETMRKYFDYCIPIPPLPQDASYVSHYSHFNTLLTCNFIYAYKLTNYEKVCILESDMVITRNISEIFDLPVPSVLFISPEKTKSYNPSECSPINGGVLLFKPTRYAWYKSLYLLPNVMKENAKYPNEELFLRTWRNISNLPERYNYCHYHLSKLHKNAPLPSIIHFNETKWKYLDIVKDEFTNKFPAKVRVVAFFKKHFYDKYYDEIEAIMANARIN